MPVSRNRHRSSSKKKASQYHRNLRQRTHLAEQDAEIAKAKATYAREHGKAAYATLLAVLRACGGGVTVSHADIDVIAKDYDHFEFVIKPIEDGEGIEYYEVVLLDRRDMRHETPGESLAETPVCTDTTADTTSVLTGPPSPSPVATASPSTSASAEGTSGE
jgi:hypothetical protein